MVNSLGFTRCEVDQAVFFKCKPNDELMIIVIHVNSCTIVGSSLVLVMDMKEWVNEHVKVMDLCELHWFLGIEGRRNKEISTIFFTQQSYIELII